MTPTLGVQPGATVDRGVGVRGEDGPGNEIAPSGATACPVQPCGAGGNDEAAGTDSLPNPDFDEEAALGGGGATATTGGTARTNTPLGRGGTQPGAGVPTEVPGIPR